MTAPSETAAWKRMERRILTDDKGENRKTLKMEGAICKWKQSGMCDETC
jgi:hypothetical protein